MLIVPNEIIYKRTQQGLGNEEADANDVEVLLRLGDQLLSSNELLFFAVVASALKRRKA